jgi:preprotein translocase subunit SecA
MPRVAVQVRELGGLFVIGTYLFDSDRVELQLFGRAGRQVNPEH